MTAADVWALLPLIVPGVGVLFVMTMIALVRNHILTAAVTLLWLTASFAAVWAGYEWPLRRLTPLLIMDGYAALFMALIYAATIATCAISYGYLEKQRTVREEYYLFLLTAALGSAMLACSGHFIMLFVSIELLSLSFYVLISYPGQGLNIEAGLKYLVPTAVSIAFLLFGSALIYAASGTMQFPETQAASSKVYAGSPLLLFAGVAMVLVGICFKLGLAPFHYWAPDVFEGAPAPVTAFLGTVSKGGVFAVIMRYASSVGVLQHDVFYAVLAFIAAASMIFGNIGALLQRNVKRILAYSSISHFGYLLVALIAGGSLAVTAVIFYLTAYFITTLTAFGVITFLSGRTDVGTLEDYRGLAAENPFYAFVLTAALLSLAGIPLTAGFFAKFYVITAGADVRLWTLLLILVFSSVVGLFYYLRVAAALYMPPVGRPAKKGVLVLGPSYSWIGGFGLAVLVASLICLGAVPEWFIQWIRALTRVVA